MKVVKQFWNGLCFIVLNNIEKGEKSCYICRLHYFIFLLVVEVSIITIQVRRLVAKTFLPFLFLILFFSRQPGLQRIVEFIRGDKWRVVIFLCCTTSSYSSQWQRCQSPLINEKDLALESFGQLLFFSLCNFSSFFILVFFDERRLWKFITHQQEMRKRLWLLLWWPEQQWLARIVVRLR